MLKYGFFNSIDGDRLYSADDLNNYFNMFFSDGIVSGLSCYAYDLGSSNKVALGLGSCLVNGKYVISDEEIVFSIPQNSTSSSRSDYIYAYCDLTNRECGIDYSEGDFPQNSSTKICVALYQINVGANTSYVSDNDIVTYETSIIQAKTNTALNKIYYNDSLSNAVKVNSSKLTLTIANSIMASNLINSIGDFNVFINGQRQEEAWYSLTATDTTELTLSLNSTSYVYAKDNNNFTQQITVEHSFIGEMS